MSNGQTRRPSSTRERVPPGILKIYLLCNGILYGQISIYVFYLFVCETFVDCWRWTRFIYDEENEVYAETSLAQAIVEFRVLLVKERLFRAECRCFSFVAATSATSDAATTTVAVIVVTATTV